MPKVLLVSPRFPPRSSSDIHRVRMSLPYYAKYGWEPTVLCVSAESSDGIEDPDLAQTLPDGIPVKAAHAWNARASRHFGFGQLSRRALVPLYRLGSQLLAREKYEVVFFSTTVFGIFVLGPIWKWRFGCKIVYDMQDPWYMGRDLPYSRKNAPGGWWKYRLDQALAKYLERFAFSAVDHVISVSVGYVDMLRQRYPRLKESQFSVIPFGATPEDYAAARKRNIRQTVFVAGSGSSKNWVFAGGIAPSMMPVVRALFVALRDWVHEDKQVESALRLYFVGTHYVMPEREVRNIEATARDCGVGKLVHERPARVPYLESLVLNTDSDGLLLIGSIDRDYTTSKLMNCVITKKPILAILHTDSLAHQIATRFPNVFLVGFSGDPEDVGVRERIREGFLWMQNPSYDRAALDREIAPWLAETLTERQCRIFDRVLVVLEDVREQDADCEMA